jgi:hypothetical protein
MTQLHEKITWAINKFNEEIAAGKPAKECLGLLGYVRKIYPKSRIPAWAREELSTEAISAAREAGFSI